MPRGAVYLETFGCQMNELDSELVAGQLAALGYRFTRAADEADVVLYNTCSVREQAEQKVWSRLGELADRKRRRPGLVVGVLGCLAERDGVDLIRRMPVVDILCGPGELDRLPALLDNAVRTREALLADGGGEDADARKPLADARGSIERGAGGTRQAPLVSAMQVALQGNSSRRSATLAAAEDNLEMLDLSRAISPIDGDDRRRSAYVRITRGCNKFCTYCVVPFTRGAEIHRPPDHIVDECRRLADAGVVEITLLGQTVNHYRFEHGAAAVVNGITQPQKGRAFTGPHRRDRIAGRVTTFADLLRRIHEEVPAVRRLRFVTSYPRDFGDDVLAVMRDSPRICRYIHAPAQSGSNRVLAKMNRGYTVEEYLDFVDRARAMLDEPHRPLMLSGDVIVGFPTETEEDFRATADLLRRVRYKNCFIFKYSPRPGTTAFERLPDDVPEAVKRRRNNELLAIQTEVSEAIGREQTGREFDVMVEGVSRRELKRSGMTRGAIRRASAVMLTIGGRAAEREDTALEGNETVQMSGRTDGDLIVFFEASAGEADALVGRIVRVRVTGASRLALFGERA